MKITILAALGFLLLFSSCRKNNDASALTGSWRLIEVFDKNTNLVSYHPPLSNMDVVITFLDGSRFAGHTLRNSLTEGSYKQTGSEIIFKNFSMTKIAEEEWGESFITVLNSCSLQASVPCASSKISIQGNIMKITSPLRFDITLERL